MRSCTEHIASFGADALVAEKHFVAAVEAYTSALELQPTAVLYANRAAAHLALEAYGSALADAEKSVEFDSSYVKASTSADLLPSVTF